MICQNLDNAIVAERGYAVVQYILSLMYDSDQGEGEKEYHEN